MKQTVKSIAIILFFCFVFVGCTKAQTTESATTPSISENHFEDLTTTPLAAPVDTVTPTIDLNNRVVTPEAVFPKSTLEKGSTIATADLCTQVPNPEVVIDGNESSLLAGRFALCVLREGISAIDLDSGILVNSDDPDADIQLQHGQTTLNNTVFYYIKAMNNAFVNEIDTISITYSFCENTLQSLKRPGIYIVQQGTIACVLTTQEKVALIRTESIDVFGVESVEFSFAILKR